MRISIDAGKALDNIQYPVMIKTLQRVGREVTYLNIIKDIYDRPTASIILSGEKLKAFSLRTGTRQESTLIILIQHSFGSPHCNNQRRKRNKRNINYKRSETVRVCI